jgi:hypothetical protein
MQTKFEHNILSWNPIEKTTNTFLLTSKKKLQVTIEGISYSSIDKHPLIRMHPHPCPPAPTGRRLQPPI